MHCCSNQSAITSKRYRAVDGEGAGVGPRGQPPRCSIPCRMAALPVRGLVPHITRCPMTVGSLKKLLDPLEDSLEIIIVGSILDDDGDDESEAWFGLRDVAVKLDQDTAEDYARFECERIDDFR